MIELQMLLKQKNTRTLVSGDKVTRLILETVNPQDLEKLAALDTVIMVKVSIEAGGDDE